MKETQRDAMQQALDALQSLQKYNGTLTGKQVTEVVTVLQDALAEPQPTQQNPVLFIHPDTFAMANAHVGAWKPGHELPGSIPLYTSPTPPPWSSSTHPSPTPPRRPTCWPPSGRPPSKPTRPARAGTTTMHTPEQARTLWCPMARVAQIGAAETNATYNRALVKSHVPVKLADASPEGFELGSEPKPMDATMLKVELQISGASRCIAEECAMWRWTDKPHPQDGIDRSNQPRHGCCGLSPLPL